MGIQKNKGLEGLEGLKGINAMSEEDRYSYLNTNIRNGKLPKGATLAMADRLYRNQLFVEEFGEDAFKSMNIKQRDQLYKDTLADRAFFDKYNPFFDDDESIIGVNGELYDANKGMGRDFFKYSKMSADAKIKLMESDWLTNSEIDDKINRQQEETHQMHMDPTFAGSEAGSAAIFSYNVIGKDLEETIDRGQNDRLIERIYSEDLKKQTSKLDPIVDKFYEENIAGLNDDEVKSQFMKVIKPSEGKGAAYVYSAYFNDDGSSSESETEKFSIDDMRQFLARKAVYDYYLGPEAGYDALNNQGKEYINDHQAWYTYCGLLGRDIAISTASYTADKWNSVRRATLLGRDSNVYMTNDGQVVPTADVQMDGNQAFCEVNGQRVPVHQQTLSLTALDDMGKDGNGEDRGWFNNAQFWSNAEQFGTMDEELQAQYKKLGYSPYKVVYKPGDETDIWYEAIKMTSFGLADMASNFIPAGGMTLGTNIINKSAKIAGMMGKAMSYAGKGLYYTSKGVKAIQPVVGATAIGHAYGRGVFGETFTGNLQQLEQSVADQAQREIYNSYNNNDEFKAQVDAEVEQEYQNLESQYKSQLKAKMDASTDSNVIYFDNSNNAAFQASLRSQALQNVLNRRTKEWEESYKNSDIYGRALQEAAESASDAALTTSLTTAAKYTAVNYGWRRYLFKTPSEMSASYRRGAIEGVTESTTAAGKKRLASKFDFLTSGDQTRELAKVVGAQMWGGAWTNATDELQSGGGRKMNEDRMSQFISGMYDGKALDARYSIMDGLSSYFHGAVQTLATENPYRAGLVGGLGSMTSFTPNLTSLVTTRNFRETWRNSSLGEKMNMLLANGVLNEYYAKKQGQLQLKATVDLVNKMLDETNDFEAIDNAIALDMASIDATNPEDANTLLFLKAVQSIDMLNRFNEDKEAAKVGQESTVLQKAMTTIEKLSDPAKLTQEEAADFLSQYYASNPGVAQSEAQNEVAFQEMQANAQSLQAASETWAEIEDTLAKVEKKRGTRLPSSVRGRLFQRLTLDKFLDDRTTDLEYKITDSRSLWENIDSSLESYGTVENQKAHRRASEHLIGKLSSQISDAYDRVDEAQAKLDEYNSTPQNDQGFVRKTQLQRALDNATIQLEHLQNIRRGIQTKLNSISERVTDEDGYTTYEEKTSNRTLSSDEILLLNPTDRARMLDKANEHLYSEEQLEQINKLRNELVIRDPSLLDDIQNQAMLTQKVEANREAYSRMLFNPEAAAYQLESDMERQALEARAFHMERTAAKLNDAISKIFDEGSLKGDDESTVRDRIYKNLRVLNKPLLEYMLDDTDTFGNVYGELRNAIDWADLTTDVSQTIDGMDVSDNQKRAFADTVDGILENSNSREEVLDELGRIVEGDGTASAKAPFESLLTELEQLWDQRASTTSMTSEERRAAREESARRAADATRAAEEAERVAREEAERRAVEADAAGITTADADTSNDRAAELEAQGLTEGDLTTNNESGLTAEQIAQAVADGEDVNLESPSLEEQAAAEPDKVDIRPAPVDDNTDQGNRLPEAADNFLGNTMYGYEINPLKFHGKQVIRRGRDANDKMSRFFDWMDAAGIKLQDIIDTELGDIMRTNPDVYPLYVDYHKNATNDDALSDFMLLAVEYNSSIQGIHNDALGGVVNANGKQYLVIGTMGFAPGNKAQGESYRQHLYDGKVKRKQYFDANPSERFFVDTSRHTQIQNATAGRLVRQLATDAEVQIRTISELLSDEARNPKGLTMGDLKWGIQYDNRLATVNVSERNTIYPPSDGASNLGSVFLLIEGANGNYIPAYIRPIRLSELRDGKLKTQLNDLINELTSTDHARRLASIKQLVQFLNLTQEGDNILIGTTDKPTVSIVKGGSVIRTFNLSDVSFDRTKFLESIAELDPRVNITTSTLADVTSLEMFDEAGALTTDLAKIGTSGASYNVYAMDADGNPIITNTVENEAPSLEAGSDLTKAQRKMNSERMGNATYRKDATNGNWYTETDKLVTDPRLIEQLNYRNLIRTRGLQADKVIGQDEVFIISRDKDNPVVIIRRRGNLIIPMTKEGATKTINEVNAELAEKARQERLQRDLEIEASNDEALRTMSDEDRRRAASEGEDVDLGLGETLTDDQIVEQITGNFEAEPSPQQRTAEELVERITTDTSDIQLSEDGSTYVDGSGKHYARVTSVIAADEFSDGRFEADNPWGLPSTTIGTGIDEFVRDFFDNKLGNMENLAARYPNATNAQLQEFARQLEELKDDFKRRGLTIVPRDITVTGAIEIATKSGDRRVLDVAGTLDLLAYDKDGNFYIFDMKTNRSVPRGESGRKKGAKWSKQLTLYKQLLQEKYGAAVKGLEIIPIQVSYPAPKGWGNATTEYTKRGGQLYADGREYRDAEPILHDNIPLPETALHIDYSKLTPLEQSMVRSIEDVAPTRDNEAPVVQPEPVRMGEDINKTGSKSLAELQSEKSTDTALSIMKSKEFGKRARTLLKTKFPDMPGKTAEIERFLQSKGIATTGITDVEQWLQMIEECK